TLSGQLPAEGDVRVFIDRVIQESERLQAILLNLRQLAELDAESIEVERERFSVAELVTELTNRYQPRAAAAGLRLRADGIADDLEVVGDRGKTDQALQNILDNSLKFTRTGEVVVSVLADDARVDIAVRDTGPGIPPRDLPRIFERFYKVDRSRGGQPGSGLGLSIARHLVELQGGTFVAYNKKFSQVTVNYQAVGSGAGIQQLTKKTVDFGASDVPLKSSEADAMGGSDKVVQLAGTLGTESLAYNLQGVSDGQLKLTPDTIAGIFLGKIKKW